MVVEGPNRFLDNKQEEDLIRLIVQVNNKIFLHKITILQT